MTTYQATHLRNIANTYDEKIQHRLNQPNGNLNLAYQDTTTRNILDALATEIETLATWLTTHTNRIKNDRCTDCHRPTGDLHDKDCIQQIVGN